MCSYRNHDSIQQHSQLVAQSATLRIIKTLVGVVMCGGGRLVVGCWLLCVPRKNIYYVKIPFVYDHKQVVLFSWLLVLSILFCVTEISAFNFFLVKSNSLSELFKESFCCTKPSICD